MTPAVETLYSLIHPSQKEATPADATDINEQAAQRRTAPFVLLTLSSPAHASRLVPVNVSCYIRAVMLRPKDGVADEALCVYWRARDSGQGEGGGAA